MQAWTVSTKPYLLEWKFISTLLDGSFGSLKSFHDKIIFIGAFIATLESQQDFAPNFSSNFPV